MKDKIFKSAPWNFSWVIKDALCACSRPQTEANIAFLKSEGVSYLITLSEEMQPHPSAKSMMNHYVIPVEEFEAPDMKHIDKFIDICTEAHEQKKVVCVHCRMGRGRTGVMLACYLVKFYDQAPQRAITNIRLMRPGSVETWEQERAVKDFWDHLSWNSS